MGCIRSNVRPPSFHRASLCFLACSYDNHPTRARFRWLVNRNLNGGERHSWSNLCVSRWRLCPEQRHPEVWRVGTHEGKWSVSRPSPPPSWRQVYGRLHESCKVPTGALSPVHLVIGKTIQQVCSLLARENLHMLDVA